MRVSLKFCDTVVDLCITQSSLLFLTPFSRDVTRSFISLQELYSLNVFKKNRLIESISINSKKLAYWRISSV